MGGLGNKVDVDESDVLEFYADDPETHAIFVYLESFKNPKRFLKIASDLTSKKPIILLKGGSTSEGARAAVAHTAALASDDRIIDGIDMADFFQGKQKKSGRESIIVYMGNDIYGVKWRNWKMNFKELETWADEVKTYGMPRLYNLYRDMQERENVFFAETWVPQVALAHLAEHNASLKKEPPIPTGTLDPYKPSK